MAKRLNVTAVIDCDTTAEADECYDLAETIAPGMEALASLTRDGNTITAIYKEVVDD